MWKSIEIKSAVIGGLVVLLVVFAVGAAYWQPENHGRFAMMGHPGRAFLLDTVSGQVWSLRVDEGHATFPEMIAGNEKEFYAPKVYYDTDPNSPVW